MKSSKNSSHNRSEFSAEPIDSTKRSTMLPATFVQQQLWSLLKQTHSTQFFTIKRIHLRGKLNITVLETAFNTLIHRHHALRAYFVEQNDTVIQSIQDTLNVQLTVQDTACDNNIDINLQQCPLFQVQLQRLTNQEYILQLACHQLIVDEHSINLLIHEWLTLYTSLEQQQSLALPELKRYTECVIWQQQHWQEEASKQKLAAWKTLLADSPILELPTDYLHPAIQSFRTSRLSFEVSTDLRHALSALSQHENVSLFVTLLTVFQVLLHRYSGQEDIVIGTQKTDRILSDCVDIVGCFTSPLVLRSDLSSNPRFCELLTRTQTVTKNAFEHAVPFQKLLEVLQLKPDLSRHPLFQVVFTFQENERNQLSYNDLSIENLPVETHFSLFDLSLNISKTTESLIVDIDYASDLFESSTISRLSGHFQNLLASVIAQPNACLSELMLLTETERQQLLVEWNNTSVELPSYLIHQLFEQQVDRAPNAIAIQYNDEQLSYAELNARANQLAHYLRELGVKPDVLVGICLERSIHQVISLLAILKAGGAYIPLDTAYPKDRLAFILSDNTPLVLLTQTKLKSLFTAISNTVTVLELDNPSPAWLNHATSNPDYESIGLTSEHLAYVMYTSGSTGKPKGAGILHRNLQNQLAWYVHESELNANDSVLIVTSYAYALTQRVTFGPLLAGARLVLAQEPFDSRTILSMIVQEHITLINLTPSGLHALSDVNTGELANLSRVFTAGEPLAIAQLLDIPEPRPYVVNNYGATECAAAVMYYRVTEHDLERYRDKIMPIGKPIWNCHIYILDKHKQLVPVGVAGEIYIGGYPVGRGYLNRPELTAEFFSKDPFVDHENAKIFKTGDLGRWRTDGHIEFLGRKDFQVKIRGFRVELGEIESALRQHPQLREAVVMVYEPIANEKSLVAYLVAKDSTIPTSSALRNYLKPKLPEFMLPSAYVFLEALPLTLNGKLNRKALPAPDSHNRIKQHDFVAPRTPIEELLTTIWTTILGLERIGIHDNFFELGGHSLLAMQVITHIQKQLNSDVPIHVLFDTPTIAELADYLQSGNQQTEVKQSIPRRTNQELAPLSDSQKGLWFLDALGGMSSVYNMSKVLRLHGKLNIHSLEMALNEIVRRHETLRTRFIKQEGEPYQKILPDLQIKLQRINISNESESLAQLIQQEAAIGFDLTTAPLLRARLLHLDEDEQILQLTFHHIISDGWSVDVLMKELSALYNAFSQGQPSPLPQLPIQYGDYVAWQQNTIQGEKLEQLSNYWTEQLKNLTTLELPTDKPHPAVQSFRGETQSFIIPREQVEKLKALSQHQGVTLFMTLLTAFNVLLHRYSRQDDIVVGTPTAGRMRPELEKSFGFFVNTLILRTTVSDNLSFLDLLARVRTVALNAYTHQDLSFEKLVEIIRPPRDRSRNPLFQVMFVLQNTPEATLHLSGISTEDLDAKTTTAMFDLTLEMLETPEGLTGYIEYATDLFVPATISRLIGHFQTLLDGIIQCPQAKISDLPLLTETERQQLLIEWSGTTVEFPENQCIHELVETQVKQRPDAIAVVYEKSQLTYAQLNTQANQLAHYLQELGIKPDQRVAICVERSLNMIIGILAILKAGGAYIPLNPVYPAERLATMIEDSEPMALLTQTQFKDLFTEITNAIPIIDLETESPAWINQPVSNLEPKQLGLTPDNLAYIIYTSGSTGKPKGVMLEHKGVCSMLIDVQLRYQLNQQSRTLQFASLAFDASVEEIFGALTSGASLVLRTDDWLTGASEFWALCEKYGITLASMSTLFWQQLAQEEHVIIPSTIDSIVIGGEAVSSHALATWFKRNTYRPRLLNAYGPTETTVLSTAYEPKPDSLSWQSIGQPTANTRCYILDANHQPVPIGLAGELYIGGVGVARGYLNRPDLTAERFINDPFFLNNYQKFNDWAYVHGYQHHCFFLFRIITGGFLHCAAWWNEEQKTWALIYCMANKINIDFVTEYNEQVTVTTASSKDAVLLPRPPKAYLQAFTGLLIDELYAKHLVARGVVEQVECIRLPTQQNDLFDSIKKSLKNQAEFIMRLPFWQYRGIYWYFICRHLNANKPLDITFPF